MTKPKEIEKEVQLLVEGNDQRNFFEAIVNHLSLNNDVQIQNFGGVDELRDFMSAFVKMPRFRSTVASFGMRRSPRRARSGASGIRWRTRACPCRIYWKSVLATAVDWG